MNPAVTVGVLAAGAMGAGEAVGYIVSELIGGIVGALFLSAVLGGAETALGTLHPRATSLWAPRPSRSRPLPAWLYLTAPIIGAIIAAIVHTGLARLAQEGTAGFSETSTFSTAFHRLTGQTPSRYRRNLD